MNVQYYESATDYARKKYGKTPVWEVETWSRTFKTTNESVADNARANGARVTFVGYQNI